MKITVEISDEFIEEDHLTDAIKKDIIQGVIVKLRDMLKTQIETEIATVARTQIEQECKGFIAKTVADFAASGTMTVSGREVKISDHLRTTFANNSGWNNPHEAIKKMADEWAKKLKAAYDGAFVTQIVQRMNEASLLKPEVATLLLEGKKEGGDA